MDTSTKVTKQASRAVTRASGLRRARYGNWQVWLFVLPPFGFLALFVIWPTLYLAYLSLFRWDGLGPMTFVGLNNYVRALSDDRILLALQHNLTWTGLALIFPPLLGLLLAILLTRPRAPGKGIFRVIYFLPQVVASAIVAVIWRWIYNPSNGPINTLLRTLGFDWQPQWLADRSLALPAVFVAYSWVAMGFSMLIFMAAISSIDESLFEAAKIDGANWWDELLHILLPGIRPAIITVLIVTAIWSFNIFDLIYLTTRGGPGDATYVISISIFSNTFASRQVGTGAALSMVLLVIVIALACLTLLRRRGEQT